MKEVKTNFSSELTIVSKGMHNADKRSRKQAFNEINEHKLRRIVYKRPPHIMIKEIHECRMMRSDRRINNRQTLDKMLLEGRNNLLLN